MAVAAFGGDAAARGALEEALLDEVGLDHVFDGVGAFADGGGDVIEADGAARKFVQHGFEEFAVHHVEAFVVYIEHLQGGIGQGGIHAAVAFHFGVVAHAAQQAVGDARGAAAAAGDFECAVVGQAHLQQGGGAGNDGGEVGAAVKLEAGDDAEAVAQGIGEHTGAGGGADEGEGGQVDFHAAGGGAFADHDV